MRWRRHDFRYLPDGLVDMGVKGRGEGRGHGDALPASVIVTAVLYENLIIDQCGETVVDGGLCGLGQKIQI